MEYGVKTSGTFVFCANCGRLISKDGTVDANFCFVCGNPLNSVGIEMKEKEINQIKQS